MITEPRRNRKNEGFFFIRVDLGRLVNKRGAKQRPKDLGDEITKVLEKSLKDSQALDTQSLNIKIG